jgi:hypothetical protein
MRDRLPLRTLLGLACLAAAPAEIAHAFSFAHDGSAGFCVGEEGRIARLDL